jgi:hypothetical protein
MITTPKSKKGKEKCRPSPQRLVFHVDSVGLALQPRARRAAHHPAGSFTTRLSTRRGAEGVPTTLRLSVT